MLYSSLLFLPVFVLIIQSTILFQQNTSIFNLKIEVFIRIKTNYGMKKASQIMAGLFIKNNTAK